MRNSGKKKNHMSPHRRAGSGLVFVPTSLGPGTGALQEGGMNSAAKICTIRAEQLLGQTSVSPGNLCLWSDKNYTPQWSPWALVWAAPGGLHGCWTPWAVWAWRARPVPARALQRKDCAPCSILFQKMLLKTSFPIHTVELCMLLLIRAVNGERCSMLK